MKKVLPERYICKKLSKLKQKTINDSVELFFLIYLTIKFICFILILDICIRLDTSYVLIPIMLLILTTLSLIFTMKFFLKENFSIKSYEKFRKILLIDTLIVLLIISSYFDWIYFALLFIVIHTAFMLLSITKDIQSNSYFIEYIYE